MNNINMSNTTKPSYKKTGDFVIKRSSPLNIKKPVPAGNTITSMRGLEIGPDQLQKEPIKPKGQVTRVPSRGSSKTYSTGYSTDVYQPTGLTNQYESEPKFEIKQIEPQLPSSYQFRDTKETISVEQVPKAKYDELRSKYDELLVKFDESKKKVREIDSLYKYELQKSKEIQEENRVLKQKYKEAQKQKQTRAQQMIHAHPHEETKNEMDENEMRSLQLALRFEAENILMNQLTQIATMQMQYDRYEQQPNRSIDLNNPHTINPDQMTYEQLLELEEKMGKVSRGLSKEEIKKIPKHKYHKLGKDEQCSICFSDFANGEKLRKLSCTHQYHSGCIKQWLTNVKSCPVCKTEAVVP